MKAAADTDNCGVCVNERRLCFGGAGGGRRVAAGLVDAGSGRRAGRDEFPGAQVHRGGD